jgi:hypothetical protein
MAERPKMKRALTQKYDMHQLHALTALEDQFLRNLAVIYKIEDIDDLPCSIDLLAIFQGKAAERRATLEAELKEAPGSCEALINNVVAEMDKLDLPTGTGLP